MWNTLKRRLFKQYDFPPISMDELWTRTFETWYEITEKECQIYIETMPQRCDSSLPSNYRPISLTSIFRKLLELSLSPWLSSVSPPLDLAQGGFRPRRSALDQALCLHELIQSYYRRSHRFPVVAFLDIKSAYDTVDRRVIWDALSRSGASSPFLSLLVHLFDDVSVSVLVSNHSSSAFSPATGVLQGPVLSPHLYINTLPALLRQVAAPATHLVPSSGSADAVSQRDAQAL
ncbi:hypothetical protein G6F36_014306 [Rhizopus arrhizus]|nr:hypothetical protein G6F36_014306 [Rhizopus arrhizus]